MAHVHAFSEANKQYVAAYPAEYTALAMPPSRKVAVGSYLRTPTTFLLTEFHYPVTCMDARLE